MMHNQSTTGKTKGNPSDLKSIFNTIVKECQRSATKMDLHPDPVEEQSLAIALNKVIVKYGETIASQFQYQYENKKPELSFLFAQVTNAVLQRTFHEGRCHLQAAYGLFELCKKNIFNASLVNSKTGDPRTEHLYLMILDDYTFKTLSQMPKIFVAVQPNGFNKEAIFFDTWSDQLCQWKNFEPKNPYTNAIKNTTQAMFRPLVHLFKDEASVIKNIIWCLIEYENYLKNLKIVAPKPIENELINEMELLSDPGKCLAKLLSTIDSYKKEFSEVLSLYNQNAVKSEQKKDVKTDPKDIEKKIINLSSLTKSFFNTEITTAWKEYPQDRLINTKYAGHSAVFFTMREDTSSKAEGFTNYLKGKGLDVELKKAKGSPSIVADLTTSTFKP